MTEDSDAELAHKIIKLQHNDSYYLLELNKILGAGAYGVVFLAVDRENSNQIYAVKVMKKKKLEFERRYERVRRETKILSHVHSKHVVAYKMASETP